MNTVQRLLSNVTLAFIANVMVKASSSLLFIFIGRNLGAANAGIYNLGVTYFTIAMALSAWGLHELLIREVATRREQSGHYLLNYLVMRWVLSSAAYGILLLLLRFLLPYSEEIETVIRILALAIFPEATFSMLQALFVAHERLLVPTSAAFVNSVLKLGGGLWFLFQGHPVSTIAWVIPIGSTISLLVFIPALVRLFQSVPQQVTAQLSIKFNIAQLKYTPGFILIGIFSTLDFQIDALLISLLLTKSDIGWYGGAQTVMLAFWMIPVAIRTAIYPVMARYYQENPEKLAWFYRRANQYLLLAVLPMATGICLLADPIIHIIFGQGFKPAADVLQWMIWAVVFAFLNVPSARLLIVYNHQHQAGWMTGLSMITNVILNIWLLPRYGIVGAGIARTLASGVFFGALYFYVQRHIIQGNILPLLWQPLLATGAMAVVVWLLRDIPLFGVILAGIIVYAVVIFLVKGVPKEDMQYIFRLTKF
ncbi:MAG: hypothetical protein CSA11_02905 [Chloroflexi bacterium]|nr:MAG: hypothetical protein CSA11_02905 [Chloroflexota bacterium]